VQKKIREENNISVTPDMTHVITSSEAVAPECLHLDISCRTMAVIKTKCNKWHSTNKPYPLMHVCRIKKHWQDKYWDTVFAKSVYTILNYYFLYSFLLQMQIRWWRAVKILNMYLPETQIVTNWIHGAQKLIFANLVTFLEFYENQNFFTMFRKACARSWAKWSQSANCHVNNLKSVFI
jgi:hypothetical protein